MKTTTRALLKVTITGGFLFLVPPGVDGAPRPRGAAVREEAVRTESLFKPSPKAAKNPNN